MPQTVQVAGVGEIEFPDDMQSEDIMGVLQKHFLPPPQPVNVPRGTIVPPLPRTTGTWQRPPGSIQQPALTPGALLKAAIRANFEPVGPKLPSPTAGLSEQQVRTLPTASKAALVAAKAGGGAFDIARTPFTWETAGIGPIALKLFGKAAPYVEKAVIAAFAGQTTKDAAQTAGELVAEAKSQHPDQKKIIELAGALIPTTGFAGLAATGAALPVRAKPTLKSTIEQAAPILPKAAEATAAATTEGAPNASDITSPESVSVPEVRQGVGETPPLRQQRPPASAQAPSQGARPPEHQAEFALAPEHQAILDTERARIDTPVEVRTPTSENEPFARQIATVDREKGTIEVNPREFAAWLDRVPAANWHRAAASLLSEERNHLATKDEDAEKYLGTTTALEQRNSQRIYGGKNWEQRPLSPLMLGHEMVRMRMQQLARMDVREAIEASGREKWTVKSLLALNDVIRGIRETLGTKASKEGLAILAKIQGNLDAAIVAAGGQAQGAQSKLTDEDREHYKVLQARLAELSKGDFNAPDFADKLAPVFKEMEDIKGKNNGYAPGTEPQEPGAIRKGREEKTQEFFLPPLKEAGEHVGAAEAGALPEIKVPPQEALHPNTVLWSNPDAWRRLGNELLTKPRALGDDLTKDARVASSPTGSGKRSIVKSGDEWIVRGERHAWPVSVTRRLVALQNQQGGVDVVSIYKDAVDGARLVDPDYARAGRERPNVPIKTLLDEGYKPIASILRSEPVTNFHRHFESLAQFEQTVGSFMDAQKAQVQGYETPVGSTQASHFGQGGEITAAEAHALHDHFTGAATPEAALDAIAASPNLQQIRSAFRKAIAGIAQETPEISREQATEKALNDFYENAKSQSRDDFAKNTTARFGQETSGDTGLPEPEYVNDLGRPAPAEEPGAIRKDVSDEWENLKRGMRAYVARRDVKRQIPVLVDAAQTNAKADTAGAKSDIIIASRSAIDPALKGRDLKRAKAAVDTEATKRREAGIAYVAAGVKGKAAQGQLPIITADPAKMTGFEKLLDNAEAKARTWSYSLNPAKRAEAKRWTSAVKKYREGLDYAKVHWNDPEFQDAAETYRKEMDDHLKFLESNGVTVEERENYIPGLFEGAFWGDDTITFGSRRLLGAQYRLPKKFANPYEAIAEGPYYLSSTDLANLAEYRIYQGHNMAERRMAFQSLQGLRDPASQEPVAKEPKMTTKEVTDPLTGEKHNETIWSAPGLDYQLIRFQNGGKPLAVRLGYRSIVEDMILPGFVSKIRVGDFEIGKAALIINQMLKHGVILLWDSFHPGRLGQYALASMGFKGYGFKGGSSALSLRFDSLDNAVKTGLITNEAADWAKTPVTLKSTRGNITVTRHQLARELVNSGLNAGKNADSLYKDAVQALPLIGEAYHRRLAPFNRWLFDNFIPGVMTESAVRNVERLNAAHPDVHPGKLLRDVARDTNIYFGNMGRQGIFRNPSLRELAQVTFLAPMWQEGLCRKELTFAARASGLSALTGSRKGLPYMGALGSAMAKGLGAYLLATQIANLITRGHFTWQNKEEAHKLDAWIPTGDGQTGLWLSPMSVFAEVTHDIIRLHEANKTTQKIVAQMGENRLGPIGKLGTILGTGRSPEGRVYSTTAGRLAGALGQITPGVAVSPITFGAPAREVGHALLPNTIAPNPPGRLVRQFGATLFGIKTEVSQTTAQQIQQKATEFAHARGLKPDTGWIEVQTSDPSYSKLRSAIRLGDNKEARKQFDAMVSSHGGGETGTRAVFKAMKAASQRPFTGSHNAETLFIMSLSDKELAEYRQAVQEREANWQKFEHWYITGR